MRQASEWANEIIPPSWATVQGEGKALADKQRAYFEGVILAIQRDVIQAAAGKCKHLADETEANSDGAPFDAGFEAGANSCSKSILSLLPEAKSESRL